MKNYARSKYEFLHAIQVVFLSRILTLGILEELGCYNVEIGLEGASHRMKHYLMDYKSDQN